ncbi:ABC transporter ATP-binding protein [Chloroflexota bacterium]
MKLLETQGLTKYFGKLAAVSKFDFSIDEGELRGLIGPNGSGKSTLFGLLSGFHKADEGKVIWQGLEFTKKAPHARVKLGIGRTFQSNVLYDDLTALENVIIACHLHLGTNLWQQFFRLPKTIEKEKGMEKRAWELLELMGMPDKANVMAKDLPHGYQRCLGIAIGLATQPKLLMLDEPVAGLNTMETNDVMDRIIKLNKGGLTVLLVEHNMQTVMRCCRKITVINFGQKIAEGTPEEITKNQDVIEAYLGHREIC